MPDFVFDIPTQRLAVMLSLLAVAAMLVGILVVKPILRLLVGTGPDFNSAVSYATGGFSLFYGLLLGLLTVAAYQNSERVEQAILGEATTLGSIYATMNIYGEPTQSEAKELMRDYVLFTINKDWPAHREGLILNGGHARVDAIRRVLADFEPQTVGEEVVHAEVMSSFRAFSAERQGRLAGVIAQIPPVLWYAVLAGAVINILLLAILKMRLLPQFVLGTITAFFLGVILFVIVTLDRPLRGESALQPVPLELLWQRSMVWDEPFS